MSTANGATSATTNTRMERLLRTFSHATKRHRIRTNDLLLYVDDVACERTYARHRVRQFKKRARVRARALALAERVRRGRANSVAASTATSSPPPPPTKTWLAHVDALVRCVDDAMHQDAQIDANLNDVEHDTRELRAESRALRNDLLRQYRQLMTIRTPLAAEPVFVYGAAERPIPSAYTRPTLTSTTAAVQAAARRGDRRSTDAVKSTTQSQRRKRACTNA